MIAGLSRLATFFMLCAVLTISGCASWGFGSAKNNTSAQRVAGVLNHTNEQWTLQLCGAEQADPIEADGQLSELFGKVAEPGQTAIFVELDAEQHDGRWQVRDIRRMLSTGRGCLDDSATASQWVGLSFNPNWRVDITDQGMELTLAGSETGQRVSIISEQLPDGSRSFRDSGERNLELWLYPSACFEPVSGDYYHLSATLLRDGQRLNGCGYQGGVDHTPR